MEAPYHIYFFQINLRVSQWKALSVKGGTILTPDE